MSDADGFFSRWSRRKAQVQRGEAPVEPAVEAPGPAPERPMAVDAPREMPMASEPAPLPTMDDVARITPASDFSDFVRPGVDETVKRAALKKLFTDPHFNTMDGLDTYIEDFNLTTPLSASMLRQMVSARALGLFQDEPESPGHDPMAAIPDGVVGADAAQSTDSPADAEAATTDSTHDDHADLQLQPHDAPGQPDPGPGTERGHPGS